MRRCTKSLKRPSSGRVRHEQGAPRGARPQAREVDSTTIASVRMMIAGIIVLSADRELRAARRSHHRLISRVPKIADTRVAPNDPPPRAVRNQRLRQENEGEGNMERKCCKPRCIDASWCVGACLSHTWRLGNCPRTLSEHSRTHSAYVASVDSCYRRDAHRSPAAPLPRAHTLSCAPPRCGRERNADADLTQEEACTEARAHRASLDGLPPATLFEKGPAGLDA